MRVQFKFALCALIGAFGLMLALLRGRPSGASSSLSFQSPNEKVAAVQPRAIHDKPGPNGIIEFSGADEKKLETLLYAVTQLKAEPFDLQTLHELDRNLSRFPSPRERLQAAVLLNRYGRSSGAEYLRSVLRQNPAEGTLATLALTMSQDKGALPLIEANFGACANNPEFAEAVSRWAEPALADKAHSLVSVPGLGPSVAKILIRMGDTRTDRPVLANILSAAMASSGSRPALNAYEAALVKIGEAPADPFLQRFREMVNKPMRVEGWVKEPLALAIPEHRNAVIKQIFDQYIERRELTTALYRKYAETVRSGTGDRRSFPQYPAAEEQLLREAVSVVVDENLRSFTQPIYKSLAAAQGAVYQPLLNRELIAALIVLDPEQSRATLLGMEFPEAEIDAGEALSKLHPIPFVLRPRQMEIALSRRVDADPPR